MNKPLSFFTGLAKLGVTRPRDLRHVLGIANWAFGEIADPEADTRAFHQTPLDELIGKPLRFHLQSFPGIGASVSLAESAALAALIHKTKARRVFEFGTYKGVSTTQLALNLPPEGRVFTLDLPEDHPAYSLAIKSDAERTIANETGKGILIPDDLREKVTFLRSDSATFDTSPYEASMDFVFVDGAHSYEYVKNDTEKGLQMLRKGGIIAWHDCTPSHKDVVKFLRSLPQQPSLVSGTALAYLAVE